MSWWSDAGDWFDDIVNRFRHDNEEHRREDRDIDEEVETNEVESVHSSSGPPKVVKVDFYTKKNAENHHCDKYELVNRGSKNNVLRRGDTFNFELNFNQKIDFKKTHLLILYFDFGSRPNIRNGTRGLLEVSGKVLFDKDHEDWDVRVQELAGAKAVLEIQIPTDAPVGVWRLVTEVSLRGNNEVPKSVKRYDELLYILFNPWNKHDSVYLEDEELRNEYVLNDVGKIWKGSYPDARGRQWVFGQFDDAVLPACVLLLERSGLKAVVRHDPIRVTRAISKIVNSNDDDGVLVGRWDNEYSDGISPSAWTGSIRILENYMKTNRPVQYGQCWVFSGVTTTVCRALGIPCRSVSNLNSAHDTNTSLTIDKYYDKKGDELKWRPGHDNPEGLEDSIWNFHVWNDVWMTRPDLPSGFGGWQAIDATPQETSSGLYQCGPASLEAVRRGRMDLQYDVSFVLAEVNADVITWQEDNASEDGFKKLRTDKTRVGRLLLTKKPGEIDHSYFKETDKQTLNKDYKANEGTDAERITITHAAHSSRAARHAFRLPSVANEDVEFKLVELERVPIGDDFTVTVKIKNTSGEKRTASVVIGVVSEYYTGVKAHDIKRKEAVYVLGAGHSETIQLLITYKEYYDKLVEYSMMKLVGMANVKETGQGWYDDDIFQVVKPNIRIEVPIAGTVGKTMVAQFSFTNPLDVTLKNCYLVIDGPGITRPKHIPIGNVEPKSEMSFKQKVLPKQIGARSLVATFNSTQLVDLTGSTCIQVSV